ncbi:hypothetical protein AB0J94_18635 [Micromonospora noduli]|uniref:hypothetical protein n=1 Tax=Micromonospora noduli TaxID=709876 RepID=UPI000DDB2096|nr:hypothetical protein [Micromonospora noduli]
MQDGERTATALMGGGERVFLMRFWARGVCLARGDTDDLHAVAGAMRAWQSGSRLRELGHEWPFVAFSPLAEAHERGEAAEYTWSQYHRNTRTLLAAWPWSWPGWRIDHRRCTPLPARRQSGELLRVRRSQSWVSARSRVGCS